MTRSFIDSAADFEPFQRGQLRRLGIKAPEAVALEQQGRGHVQQVVGAKAVLRRMPEGEFLELLFKFRRRNDSRPQKLCALNVAAEIRVGERGLLRGDEGLTAFASDENVKLKCGS